MSANATHVLLRALVDELARCGLRAAATSPGSRNTPILLALAHERRVRCYSHIDERCAGFFALGLAKASRRPVAVTCTSGTAAAELVPAVVEAHQARVPLIVLTADRPPRLRDVGAGQTIDQLKLYGAAVKWFVEVGVAPDADPSHERWIRELACRAYWTALGDAPGPVHLNLPLTEPLVPDGPVPRGAGGRADRAPWVARAATQADASGGAVLEEALAGARRGVVVTGRHERDPRLAEAVARFAGDAGYPLLADPLSGARTGPAAIAHYDALLREPGFAAAQRPDVVIRVGDLPTSKPLRSWLAGLTDAHQLALDPEGAWQDPDGALSAVVAGDPRAALAAAARPPAADPAWLAHWTAADRAAAEAIAGPLGDELCEPRVAAELGRLLPPEATLFVASSMPVRDVEAFWAPRERPPRVLSNRGANGIDGTVSAAFGAAAASDGPVVALVGDVALAHDLGGLLAGRRLGLSLTVVVVHNDGGGIFDFLPVAAAGEVFAEQIATPHGLDFGLAARLYGADHERLATVAELRGALHRTLGAATTTILEVRTDRAANRAVHERAWAAVADAIA